LFLTALALVLLTQTVILRWGPEAVFFVTWLLLALAVQHDSRLSAAMGLVFLASCPFLLIAKKEPVAEQAANYAYFFLAIGVLVQLEELVLERFGWLNRKLDFSYLWQPVNDAFRRQWSAAGQILAERGRPMRSIQIIGTAGLVVAFVVAVLSKAQLAVVLPLLGGAVLFPFLVGGLSLTARVCGPGWLLRGVLALVVLPLAAAEMVWLYNLLKADQMAGLRVTYDFIDHLSESLRPTPPEEGERVELRLWTIEKITRRVIFQHPAYAGSSRITYQADVGREAKLAFDLAMAPESWTQEGDGVAFAVYIVVDGITRQVFSTYIDPKHNEADRRWNPYVVDLSAYAGKPVSFIFETNVGPAGDYRYDWAGWGEPRLLTP
jgi:hypothetical protein